MLELAKNLATVIFYLTVQVLLLSAIQTKLPKSPKVDLFLTAMMITLKCSTGGYMWIEVPLIDASLCKPKTNEIRLTNLTV